MGSPTPTPLKWSRTHRIEQELGINGFYAVRGNVGNMAVCYVADRDDADLVVKAVNNHDALLEAAKHAAMEWRLHGQLTDSCRILEAAIALAEGSTHDAPVEKK